MNRRFGHDRSYPPVNTAVYYPYIWPRTKWLRLGALCWDKVYSVTIPNRAGPPEDVRALMTALPDFLDASSLLAPSFVDDELIARFKRWVDDREDTLRAELVGDRQSLFGVYDTKFWRPMATEESIRDWLVDRGLARIEEPDTAEYGLDGDDVTEIGASMFIEDTVVYLPKDIALHYLALIAARAAAEQKRDLAADQAAFTDAVFNDASRARANVASSVLEAYLPEDFEQLELARIAELREHLATRRLKFQVAVQELVAEYERVSSEGELASIEHQLVEIAEERVEETRDAYRRAHLSTAVQSFGITLTPPALASSVASAIGVGIFAPVGIALAFSLFAAGALLKHREAAAARMDSPWSYVLDLASQAG
jgi:hypothetical protein